MDLRKVREDIFLLDLPQKREGFRKFLSSWIIKHDDRGMIVDVGPGSTIPQFREAFDLLGIKNVEYVLLTHIHIDHGGGIGNFLEFWPEAKVVVGKIGQRHLLNPERLWESSKKGLGDLADLFGEIKAIPETSIHQGEVKFANKQIGIIQTPGHASHHQSYIFGEHLFLGEAAGIYIDLGERFYLRPATPPGFIYDVAINSIESLIREGKGKICYFGHFGFSKEGLKILKIAEEQLRNWVEVVQKEAGRHNFSEKAIEASKEKLLKNDQIFSNYYLLEDDIKKREDYFIGNSLRGILEYLKGFKD